MALRRVFVIDNSPAIRETISVVLAGEYDVQTFSHADYGGSGAARQTQPDLLIIGTEHPGSLRRGSNPPAGVPVLWLLPPGAPELPASSPVSTRQVLSRSFLPWELRARVDQMLCPAPCAAPGAAEVAERSRIEPPFLSPEAADMARAAIQSQLPVLVCGPLGMGRSTLARAIHMLGKGATFTALDAQVFAAHTAANEPEGGDGTVFIDRLERLGADGQQHLLARLQPDGRLSAAGGGSLRVIGGAEAELEESVARGEFSAELYYRISVLPVRLVPLRERTHDIPDLVRLVAAHLAQSLGLPPVSFTPSALQRLSNYLWFGDVIELEAVLARTLMLARKQPIDAGDLVFEGTRPLPPTTRAATTESTPPSLAHAPADHTLELVVNELAHELKNPMVTIKTFAQHLRRLVYNGEEEEQVARLTGEAVDQIDQVIENLLQFTRFETPVRESVALPALLGPAVAALAQTLKPRSRRVDYRPPPPVSVWVDRAQMTYALTNLFRGLARGLGETGRITVGVRDPASIQIELPSGFDPTDSRLAAYLSGGVDGQAPLPLTTAIANSLIERNGGVLAFELDRPPPTVTVHLPVADQEESTLAGNGKASRPHRR